MMVTDKHYRLARLTRNAPVFAAVVVTTIIVPQIILRAASTGSGRTEIVVSALVGAAGLAVAFLTDIWIYRLAPRRAIHQLASVYLGGGAAIVVASARFVCHTLFVVLGAGLAVSGVAHWLISALSSGLCLSPPFLCWPYLCSLDGR
ncbi:hypothetical protein [Actinobaculum sp. 313]|uniref:hypothetical protein n=1 Tax=Actinobaculum sp. 313 TaxID=2495645 RepID=UPI000D52898F|nr:hypothetical protein [Actinobaculum sp. 313]AWE42502.1 hypothetical protein DDD63_06775 [Actinobaculum sp. 313]